MPRRHDERFPIDEVPSKEYRVELYGQAFGEFGTAKEVLDVWQTSFVVRDSSDRFLQKVDLEQLAALGK
jgi:hypothetical protein